MEIIEILDEKTYDVNNDIFSDSSSDNENIKKTEMAYFTKNFGISIIIYSTVPIEYPTSSDGVYTIQYDNIPVINITFLTAQDSQCKFKQMIPLVPDDLNLYDYWKKNLTNIVGLLDVLTVSHRD
ncbi:unnamed protein product [Rhizophagus irregularis]|uniref:Uncharacterized protein n=1 Tax=Rhizophagus irregularis TaxID=588596 RepID=A0A2I1G2F6_9GLOM|nr:hypothetical protein RhiirA4_454228 [Rhizophagus irregularis]CAB4414077.1 unnamed protein product [Rhizophagus irregularis]